MSENAATVQQLAEATQRLLRVLLDLTGGRPYSVCSKAGKVLPMAHGATTWQGGGLTLNGHNRFEQDVGGPGSASTGSAQARGPLLTLMNVPS